MGYLIDIFLVLSNLAFIVPAVVSWQYGHGTMAFIYALIVVVSGSYHLCDSYAGTCIFTFRTHQALDFIIASSTIPIIALYFIYFRRDRGAGRAYIPFLKKWLVLLAIFINAVVVVACDSTLWSQALVTMGSLLLVIFYWIVFSRSVARFRDLYDWTMVALGLTLTTISIACFIVQNFYPSMYWM